jgi:glycosyltransferase involved in cell wall biosynthesis
MISVIIPTLNAARLLPRAFQSLFEAAMDGLVSEVIVSDSGSADATLAIAEAAGATVIAARREQQRLAGALAAKKAWLLFLEPGDVIERGWEQEIRSFIAKGESRGAAFRMRKGKGIRMAASDAIAALRFRLSGRPAKGQALLVPAKLLQKTGAPASRPQDDDAALMRDLCRSAFVRLQAAVFQRAG